MAIFDVIVIGSGIAGLNSALRLADGGKRVAILTKKRVAHTATNYAQGGIAAVLSKLDSIEKHVQDTLVAGGHHNSRRAVEYMVKHSASAIARLVELGVPFATQEGTLLLTREGGHSERRIAFVSDYTGQAIEEVLVQRTKKHSQITLLEHTFVTELIVKGGICRGVAVIRHEKAEVLTADSIILASGGCGQIFKYTTNPAISTGDGITMAHTVGCRLKDMEFVQFHPTAFVFKGKTRFLISEAVRGEGAYLRNSTGERFMEKIHPLKELAPRDIVSRAIFEEEKKGLVYLDIRHKKPKEIQTRFPQIYQHLKDYGLDLTRDLIPISPAAHYLCGGVRVDLHGQTDIKNLFACGEVTCTGVHGANRLASNSLLEAVVFSEAIIATIAGNKKNSISRKHFYKKIRQPRVLTKTDKKTCKEIRSAIKKIMWENVGIVRTKKSLKNAKKLLRELEEDFKKIRRYNELTVETRSMLAVAQAITKAAQTRKKSLGCHFMA